MLIERNDHLLFYGDSITDADRCGENNNNGLGSGYAALRGDGGRRVAVDFAAMFVPLDGIFAAAACRREMDYWLPDGVHPTPAGHGLIAQHWIAAVAGR